MGDNAMKKIRIALITFAIIMAAGACAWAGTFDGYWDFKQEDGTYAYGFPRVLVSMDKTWYRNTRVILGRTKEVRTPLVGMILLDMRGELPYRDGYYIEAI